MTRTFAIVWVIAALVLGLFEGLEGVSVPVALASLGVLLAAWVFAQWNGW